MRAPFFLSGDFKAKICKDYRQPLDSRALVKARRDLVRG